MNDQQEPLTQQDVEQKPEHTDELDIFGGLLVKLGKYFITLYRNLFSKQQNS